MSDFNWSQFKGDYVKWVTPGQSVEGAVTAVTVGRFQDTEYPELTLDGPVQGMVKVGASQQGLSRALAADPPAIGDWVRIVYTGEGQARPGFNPPKLFEVKVTHRGGSGVAAGPSPADLV